VGDEPVWSGHKTGEAERIERLTDGICRPSPKHPDGTHWRDMTSRDSVMKIHFIEDRQKITLRASLTLEQRQSGRERIGLPWRILLPNLLRGLFRRGRSHCHT
jgi:hypothetical protein